MGTGSSLADLARAPYLQSTKSVMQRMRFEEPVCISKVRGLISADFFIVLQIYLPAFFIIHSGKPMEKCIDNVAPFPGIFQLHIHPDVNHFAVRSRKRD